MKYIRIKSHTPVKLNQWIPLYIGKSKNISKRLQEHVFSKDMNAKTYALKLSHRKNLMGKSFRITAIEVNVKNYDLILPVLESTLRNRINPIIGRQ